VSGSDVEVAIIGSGFAGLAMAIRLALRGERRFRILEKAAEIGGTWRDNTYPGCACDIPSPLYSLSFEPNRDWTRLYPTQPEIWSYMRAAVDRHGLRAQTWLNAEVAEAAFDEAAGLWRIRTADGRALTARFLVSGMGGLSRPAVPDLPGLDRFRGKIFHSAAWDHGYDLRDKRVAVIGTGASAVQFVPEIAPKVSRLHLFQRTPNWIIPKADRSFGPFERWLVRNVAAYRKALRGWIYAYHELRFMGFSGNERLRRFVEGQALRHLARQVPDPELRAQLTPDYALGCKRVLISNEFYPALTRPNVHLETAGVRGIEEDAVVTADGRRLEVDAIILATGFRAAEVPAPVRILGRGGVDLSDAWADGISAYLGLLVKDYPNLFLLIGPNTGLGHNSIIFMIEAQVDYILRCLDLMRARGASLVEVTARAQDGFNREIQEKLRRTVWLSGCRSWYLDSRGRNVTLWPDFTARFWARTRRVREADLRFAAVPAE